MNGNDATDKARQDQPFVIRPFKWQGLWVFSDPSQSLVNEPLINGTDEVIERAASLAGIRHPERGFVVMFSDHPFDGSNIVLEWLRRGNTPGSNVYYWPEEDLTAWLCPALLLWWPEAPARIFVAIKLLEEKVSS